MNLAGARIARIREALITAFAPAHLNITDDSHAHAGHTGARGGGHYTIDIVTDMFQNKNLLERHRMVYAALQELMNQDIHALSISARTPQEVHHQP